MGTFDWVELPNGEWEQVKCWGRILDSYRPGDNVGPVDNVGTYSIALIEGGYLNVSDDIFIDVTEEPRYTRIFDKWGDEYVFQSGWRFHYTRESLSVTGRITL